MSQTILSPLIPMLHIIFIIPQLIIISPVGVCIIDFMSDIDTYSPGSPETDNLRKLPTISCFSRQFFGVNFSFQVFRYVL